ncbi:MAG: hypothetical protein AB3N14_08025 [Flavobacteriaceae bacterium]
MKKVLTLLAFISLCISANSQEIAQNALGLRLGDNNGFGAEVSYQTALNENNRLEFDLGWRSGSGYDGFQLTGLYQWVWNIDGGFNWYAGAGGGVGSYSFDDDNLDGDTFLFLAGDIGVEYNFDIPLLVSLDFRPEFGFGDFRDDLDLDIALGVRYQF